jgi:hypothetical protein
LAEVEDLQAQLNALKVCGLVDPVVEILISSQCTGHDPIANTVFKSKLNKDRMLSSNDDIQAIISKELDNNLVISAPPGSPAAKVQSRLLSSKTLAVEVAAVVEDLKIYLDPEHSDHVKKQDAGLIAEWPTLTLASETGKDGDTVDSDQDGEVDDGSVEQDDVGWESGSIAGEFQTIADLDHGSVGEAVIGSDQSGSSFEGQGDSEDEEESDANLQVNSLQRRGDVPPTRLKSQSTFLPSLAVGYIPVKPDDSDWSDGDTKAADGPRKKNRRGQRARRA